MEKVIFGIRPVLEAIESGQEIERVFFRKGGDSQLLSELKEICRRERINSQEVPIERLNRFTRANHQGVVAQISAIEYVELTDIIDGIPEGETPLIMLLDGVTDVRNFGAIARSAECAGAHGLIVSSKNAAPVNADAIKSSAGALTRISVCRVGSLRTAIMTLKNSGMQIVVASEKSRVLLFNSDMTKPTVIVMGSEDKGVSKEIVKMADIEIAIPIVGEIESLNVSAAAAVMLFEAVRQRVGESI